MEPKKQESEFLNMIFNEIYQVDSKLSEGSFGVVYLANDLKKKKKVAIKIEKPSILIKNSLFQEAQLLKKLQGVEGIPVFYCYGKKFMYIFFIIELLGTDLYKFFKQQHKFSLKTVCMIANQMLRILNTIHERGVLHRDIKPENIMIGLNEKRKNLYLIDFGISKEYKEDGRHIPYREGKPFLGTVRFASIAAHKGVELGRKDDLESLGYLLIYFIKGRLPWQKNTRMSEIDRRKMVSDLKQNISIDDLCFTLPIAFSLYIKYVKNLSFKEIPNYQYLIQLFLDLANEKNIDLKDGNYDWTRKKCYTEICKSEKDLICSEKNNFKIEGVLNNDNIIEIFEEKKVKINEDEFDIGDENPINFKKREDIRFKNPFILFPEDNLSSLQPENKIKIDGNISFEPSSVFYQPSDLGNYKEMVSANSGSLMKSIQSSFEIKSVKEIYSKENANENELLENFDHKNICRKIKKLKFGTKNNNKLFKGQTHINSTIEI